MATRWFGRPIVRTEDPRLLSGKGLFVGDVNLPRMAHAAFLRSDLAHGNILSIDVERARARAGVLAVYTADDLGDLWAPGPLLVPPPPVEGAFFVARTQVPLARGKVRHVGEPLAVVIAEDPYIAEDALEDIWAEIEYLPPVVRLESALAPDAPRIHEDLDSNLAAHLIQKKGDYEAVRDSSALKVSRKFRYDRGASAAIENRAVVADWDDRTQQLTIWDTTQAPIPIRNGLAAFFGLSESQVRVIAPDIGGGFGPKIMMFYPEEILIPWASQQLHRPVKWVEDRRENFYATTQERDQIHEAELSVDSEGHILGVRDCFIHDCGAYNPYGLTIPINSQCTLLGPYRVPNYYSEFQAVFTNKTIVTPVRGAGRQHGVFVMERLLDLAAREMGLDPAEIRRRNLLKPEEFPHNHEIIFQDLAPLEYDSGNYEPALDRALELIGYEQFRASQKQVHGVGESERLRGIGVVCYVEGTGIGPYEGARISIEPSGTVNLSTGVGTQGQGHFTSFAQIAADQLGVEPSQIRVVTGDTGVFHWGTGTFASRGAVVAGNACHAAAAAMRKKILKLASELLEAAEEDLELADGQVIVRGAPASGISLGRLAVEANPLRGAVEPGTEPGLEATSYFGPPSGTTASGVHAMLIEIDPDTCQVDIQRYVVVHDCGTVINPLILEGQIHGGVAQGIGNAFFEQLIYDDSGQLLNASLMDYLLPTSGDMPVIETDHIETPSPLNPLGIKGAGEAGAIPTGALFAQAVDDALRYWGVEILEIPLSPNRLFEILSERRQSLRQEARNRA